MNIKLSHSNILVSLAIICSFLGSGISLGTILGFVILPVRVIGLVCTVWVLLNGINNHRNQLKIQYIIVTFAYMVLVTLVFSQDYFNAIPLLLDYLCLFSIICVVLLNTNSEVAYKKYTNLYLICTLITIVICIYEYFTQNHIASNYTQNFSTSDWAYSYTLKAPTAFLYNPNNVAVLMIISLPLFFEKINEQGKVGKKIGWFVAAILDFAVIFMTGSRGGLIAGALVFAVFFLSSNIKLWKKLLFLIVISIVIIYFSGFMLKQLDYAGMLTNGKINVFADGDGGRISIAHNSIENVFKENPIFGLGAGSVENKGLISPHNTIIEVLCNYGIIGFGVFLLIMIRLGKKMLCQNNRIISILLLASFFMSMFIPPTIMTLYVLFIPLAFRASRSYFERKEFE